MSTFLTIIFIVVGFLALIVFPKIIQWLILLGLCYLTIFVSYYWAIGFIPTFLLMLYYRHRRRQQDGI